MKSHTPRKPRMTMVEMYERNAKVMAEERKFAAERQVQEDRRKHREALEVAAASAPNVKVTVIA